MSSITIRKLSITELQAWERAITACRDFIADDPDYEIEIIFCVLEDSILEKGRKILG